jgi:hypothetical protein
VLITQHHLSFPKAITAVHTPQPISLRYVVTLPSYQHVGLPRGLAPFRFHEKKTLHVFSTSSLSPKCPAHLIIHLRSAQPISRGQQLAQFSGPTEPFQTGKRLVTLSFALPTQKTEPLLKSYKLLFKVTYITSPIHFVKNMLESDPLDRPVNYFLNTFSHHHTYCTCCITKKNQ